jgi:hypothetical protein
MVDAIGSAEQPKVATLERARRAERLLKHDRGVTYLYALAAVEHDLIDPEDLRGHGPRGCRRWFLA